MNRTSMNRTWMLPSFLVCLGMLGLGVAGADERSLPGSRAGPEASEQDVTHDGWGDIQGRLVTKPGSLWGGVSRTPTNVDFIGLENAVVYARKVTRVREPDSPHKASHLPAAVLEIGQDGMTPHVVRLLIGQPLVLRNNDSRPHVFLIRPSLESETNFLVGPSQEQTVVFRYPHAAPLAVTCSLHDDKSAYVFAATHPYVAVSDANGNFVLHDLPANEPLELRVWHEMARRRYSGEIVISPEWTGGRRIVVVADGATLDLGESLIETISRSMMRR